MNIVLGIYYGKYFYEHARAVGNCRFPFDELLKGKDHNDDLHPCSIIQTVLLAGRCSDKIIFLIDGLEPNIKGGEDSYTCNELINILKDPYIDNNKIEFREDNKVVSLHYVIEKLNVQLELN